MAPPLLEVASLSKTFGGEAALVDATLTLRRGEIRGLLGANGSGKSTLIKILAGYHQPDDGSLPIRVEGEEVDPARGGLAGFRFIHQDLGLIPEMSVVDNLMLRPARGPALLRPRAGRAEHQRAQELVDAYDVRISPSALVRDLTAAERTMVALMRALRDRDAAKVIVLDEVTATLPPRETEQVLDAVRRMRHCGVLFVSHRMEEISNLCDTATVLRSGRVVADVEIADSDERRLVELVTGHRMGELYPEVAAAERDVVLTAQGVTGGAVRGVDLDVRRGEVVGVASLDPVESSTVLSLIFGTERRTAGEVTIGGRVLDASWGPSRVTGHGVTLVTDRLVSSIASFRVRENLTVGRLREISGRWRLNTRAEKAIAAELIAAFGIAPANPEAIFAGLSGGNQQKAVLARSMSLQPKLLLLDDPTRGVDVGAKTAIYRILQAASEDGLAVLIASTDFDELASLCHRVVVLRDGRVNGVVGGEQLTASHLLERCYTNGARAAAA